MKIYSREDAKRTILLRESVSSYKPSEGMKNRIKEIFGEELTLNETVAKLISEVKTKGDEAIYEWTLKIDGVKLQSTVVDQNEIDSGYEDVSQDLLDTINLAKNRIIKFHRQQPLNSWITDNLGGQVGQLIRPIEKVGFYIPSGTAPLPSTILMTVLPAYIAGTTKFSLSTPTDKSGNIPASILATVKILQKLSLDISLFRVGGALAIAALTYGTQSISRVDKIVGPGNIFVALAKKHVFGDVGIDGIYGPTEALIIADDEANPKLVAADLLAQAEHDTLSVPILLCNSQSFAEKVQEEIAQQLKLLERNSIIIEAIKNKGGIIVTGSILKSIAISNDFAPEHLSLAINDPWKYIDKIKNVGGIFLGELSCEVLGDYVAGPSHAMPTSGSAKFSSPINVLDFIKIVSLIALDEETVADLAPVAEKFAIEENLTAHANAAALRKTI
jgi:histidinol dehydrogenase